MRYKGVVQQGQKRAQTLGFPTSNIDLQGSAVSGIYAARVHVDDKAYPAAAYANVARNILEAHLLDFDGDLYGKEVEIELVEKIRDDQEFASETELEQAIAADVAKVRVYFNKYYVHRNH